MNLRKILAAIQGFSALGRGTTWDLDLPEAAGFKDISHEAWSALRQQIQKILKENAAGRPSYRIVIDSPGPARSASAPLRIKLIISGRLSHHISGKWAEGQEPDKPPFPESSPLAGDDFNGHDGSNVLYRKANNGQGHRPSSTANFAVFPDKYPQAPVHNLIVSKGEHTSIEDFDESLWEELRQVLVREIANLTEEGRDITKTGYRIVINTGPGLQTVPQMHCHILA